MRSNKVSPSQCSPFSAAGVTKPESNSIASGSFTDLRRPEYLSFEARGHQKLTPMRACNERKGRTLRKRSLNSAEFAFGNVRTKRIPSAWHRRSTSL